VRVLKRTLAWLWPARVSFVELELLQTSLVRSLLYFVIAVTGVLTVRNLLFHSFPFAPVFILDSIVVVNVVVMSLRPSYSRWVLRFSLASFLVVVYWAALQWGSAVAPGIQYLALFGLFGTLMDCPATGNIITLASLAQLLALRQRFGFADARAETLWFNVSSCTVLAQLFGLAFYHVFVSVQAQLSAQALRLQQAEDVRQGLVRALFQGLQEPVQNLALAAAQPLGEAGGQLRARVLQIADELQAAAGLQLDGSGVDSAVEAEVGLRWVRRRFMVITLWVALASVSASTLNNLLHGAPLALPLGIAAALVAALVWLRGRSVDVERVNAIQVLCYLALFIHGVWQDGFQGVPQTLPFLLNIVLAAALLAGFGVALLAGAVGLVLVVAVWILGQHSFPEAVALSNLLLSLFLMIAVCREVWNLHAHLLQQLRERARSLAVALRQRRRLLGTLFHDINNPLMAIQAILQLPKAGVPLLASDQDRVQRMALRIRQLVDAAESFLLGEARVPLASLMPVDVGQLFAETQELFEARLRAKRQRLTITAPPGLAVLALPVVLRESVISNLVSNALKFSPALADLALVASVHGDEVCLAVRDAGAGVPEDVLAALAQDRPVASRVGSVGEQGQGLGLSLVQEHLDRLGGRLELLTRAEGGTEARAWLKKA
jgi:signal transduction histidine kinase